jgi:hypothetical protein
MNPYVAQLLKRLRALPLDHLLDVVGALNYAERWVFTDRANCHCPRNKATHGEIRCVGREFFPAATIRFVHTTWEVSCLGISVGSTSDVDAACEMAETELELRGFILPWRGPT